MENNTNFKDALFVSKSLFDRKKVAGSAANMSFRDGKDIFITKSGSCFGNLKKEDFSKVDIKNKLLEGSKPSKELPIHTILYEQWKDVKAVIHVHSTYSTLWSCLEHEDLNDLIPAYTPYLMMKLGKVPMIPYFHPGTEELFKAFKERVHQSKGFIMQNHGVIVGGKSILDAFYILEELEENIRLAWELRREEKSRVIKDLDTLESLYKE